VHINIVIKNVSTKHNFEESQTVEMDRGEMTYQYYDIVSCGMYKPTQLDSTRSGGGPQV